MNNVMAKSMFLQKIQDKDYAHIVDGLMDSTHNLEHCMQRVLDKFNMLDSKKDPKGRHANANEVTKDGGKRNSRNRNGGDKDKDKKRVENRQSNNTTSSGNRERRLTIEEIKPPHST